MRKMRKSGNKGFFDGLVILIIIFTLCFTGATVSSTIMPGYEHNIELLRYDADLSEKEIQRVISVLNDDVCDDCDDDDDTTKNNEPIAIIYQIVPNPSNEFASIFFEGYGEDSDGTIIGYRWESNIDGLLSTNASFSKADLSAGMHNITFFVQDNQYVWSEPANTSLVIFENQPPQTPIISGESRIKTGVDAEFTIISSDPEQHAIFYSIDWGDGSVEEWLGSYQSNEQISISHTWDQKGTYTIKAKAKDSHDAESDWGTLPVQMTKTKFFNNYPFHELIQWIIEHYPLLSFLFQ